MSDQDWIGIPNLELIFLFRFVPTSFNFPYISHSLFFKTCTVCTFLANFIQLYTPLPRKKMRFSNFNIDREDQASSNNYSQKNIFILFKYFLINFIFNLIISNKMNIIGSLTVLFLLTIRGNFIWRGIKGTV